MTKTSETKYLSLRGKANWAKVFEENRDKTGAKTPATPEGAWIEEGGRTCINLYLDTPQIKSLKATGSLKKIFEDDEGEFVKLDRKWEAPYSYGGPPRVLHTDGETPWDIDADGLIGNGSEVIVYVSVYPSGGFVGTRMDAVQIVDHVPYESDYDPDDVGGHDIPDLTKGVEAPKKKTTKKKNDLDDEIPF